MTGSGRNGLPTGGIGRQPPALPAAVNHHLAAVPQPLGERLGPPAVAFQASASRCAVPPPDPTEPPGGSEARTRRGGSARTTPACAGHRGRKGKEILGGSRVAFGVGLLMDEGDRLRRSGGPSRRARPGRRPARHPAGWRASPVPAAPSRGRDYSPGSAPPASCPETPRTPRKSQSPARSCPAAISRASARASAGTRRTRRSTQTTLPETPAAWYSS